MLKLALTHHGISPVDHSLAKGNKLDVNSDLAGPTTEGSRPENDDGMYL